MDKEQVMRLIDNCCLPDSCENTRIIETHISWIVLTDQYAFKIKRPVKFSFLDFSTLAKRKFYREYIKLMGFEGDPNARRLLDYYKSYRANVRAKVTLLREKNSQNGYDPTAFSDVKKFIDLMDGYLDKIN